MTMRFPILAIAVLTAGCATMPPPERPSSLQLVDPTRQRAVPLLLYGHTGPGRPLVLLSHGHGGEPDDYEFIAKALANRGYLVAAIDHELPGDPPIPSGGSAYQQRMANWREGAESIAYAMRELRRRRLASPAPVVLIGHSNGGDMAMLLATTHPHLFRTVISLDNRRHPLPRTVQPRICSLRSSDQVADVGVLPPGPEQAGLGVQIIPVPVRHDDMTDRATPAQKQAMLLAVGRCLGR
jgi:predicted dienelactone hydrolase